jgi:tetratricopeptide (TPR) repeat protein
MQAKRVEELPIEAWLLLADDYIELNRDEEALEIYQKMVKQYPKDVDVWLAYSNYYAVIEDFEQACVVAKRGLELLHDNPYLLYRIANYYFLGKSSWRGVTYLRLAYHTDSELIDFFLDYDEEMIKIPEVIEIMNDFQLKSE